MRDFHQDGKQGGSALQRQGHLNGRELAAGYLQGNGHQKAAALLAGLLAILALAAPKPAHAAKTITLTSDQTNNRITEGNAGRKDVTITATLGQPAPTGGIKISLGTQTANSTASLANSCNNPRSGSDACFATTPFVDVAAGDTEATFTLRIIGDTTDEVDETLKLESTVRDPDTLDPLSGWSLSSVLTFTIEDDDGKKIRLTSDQANNRITEGDSGTKDVVLTVTLSEPAPEGGISGVVSFTNPKTAQGSNKSANPCDPPLNPADTDWCYPSGTNFTIAEGQTQATVTVKIIGDTRDESDEIITFNPSGRPQIGSAWTTANRLTLTIVDDDGKKIRLTSDQANNRITEGDSGTKDVVLTVTLSEPAPAGGVRVSVPWLNSGTTATSNSNGIDPCNPSAIGNANMDWCRTSGNTAVTIAEGQTQGTVTVKIVGDIRDESDETIIYTASGASGWTVANTLTLTIVDDDGPGVTISEEMLTVAEGASTTYTVKLNTEPGGNVTVTPTSSDTGAATVSGALNFTTGNWETAQTVTVTGAADTDTTNESVTVSHGVTGYGSVTSGPNLTVTVTDTTVAAPVLTGVTKSVSSGNEGITVTWTHSGRLLRSGSTFHYWQLSTRMKGGTWSNESTPSTTGTLSLRSLFSNKGSLPDGTVLQVRLRARGTSGDGPWSNVREITFTNTDDDYKALVFSDSSVTVGVGATSTYTVVIDDDYSFGGVVSVSSSDTNKATVSPSKLTFTTSTTTTAQTVTVTGVATGGSPQINHSFRLTGATADAIPDAGSVGVTVNNKTITLSADSTTIEEGDSGRKDVTITLRLGEGAPSNNFAVGFSLDAASTGKATTDPLSSKCANPVPADADMCWSQYVGHGSAGSFNASSLELSSGGTTGTLKIGILGDTTDEEDETLILRATKGGWTTGTLTLTIKDDDGPGVTISEDTLTMDKGDSGTYTVVLDTDPGAQVVVTPTPTAKATVSPAKLTFTTATNNWSTAQTVTVTGAVAGTATISHGVTGYSGVSGSDIDTVDVTVEETIAAPVLTTATSTTNRVINLTWTHAGTGAGDLVEGAATFSNWRLEYRRKGGGWGASGSLGNSVATRNAASPRLNYPDGTVVEVRVRATGYVGGRPTHGPVSNVREVTFKNDDKAALTIVGAPVEVAEGATATYTVALTDSYAGTLRISSDDTGIATVEPSTLTFAAATYNTAQTVTVTGVEGGQATINHAFRLTGATADMIPDAGTVSVTVKAPPSVTVEPTTLTVNEGGSGAYTVKLDTEPTADVTVTVAGESGDVSVTGSPLTFTTQNYNTAQTVTVNAAEDDDAVTDTAVTLTHSASGGGYNSVTIDSVQVTVTENDTPGVTVEPTTLTVNEGSSGAYTVKLNTEPTHNVTVTVGGASGDVTVTGSPLTFTTENYGTAQTVTVNAGEDQDTANDSATLTHGATSSDTTYGASLSIQDVSVTVTDNDTPGVTVEPTTLSVNEGGSGAYTVKLNTAPTHNVTVTVGGASGEVTVTGSPLTFTTENYGTAQTVTVNAGEDDDTTDDSATLTHSAASSDTTYGSLTIESVEVTVTDNDSPGEEEEELPPAPAQATGLTAQAGNAQVTLSWNNPDNATITKWQVQQKQADGSYGAWVDIPGSTASTVSHTVTGLTNGTAYSFRIRAVNAGGNSPASTEVRATPMAPPLKPTGVTATAGHAQVTLSWDNPDNATISKWQYQQKEGDGAYGPWMDIPNSTATTTSHTVTGLTNGTVYSFRIRAVNAGGNGAPSDEVTATPVDQDVVQADKARSQALAATSRTLLGMATDVLGARSGGEAPVALAGSGNTLGEQAMGIVEEVLGIGGSELPTALTLEDVENRLWSQSFQLTPPAKGSDGQQEWNPPSPQQRSWALWGAGELRSYRGNDDTEHLSYSGDMKTAWLGVDHQFTDRWMAGAALSFATGQSDYSYQKTDGSKDGGKMETRLTTFYPYGSFQVSEGLRLWGMAGMGWGTQHHQQTGNDAKAEGDLRLQMGVIGFEQALSPIGELSLSLAGDAGLVKSTTDWKAGSGLDDLSVSLHRIRLGIDSSFPLTAHTTGYLNLKGRLDGGDLEMNAAEIVAGLHYGKERFSGFLQGRQTYAFDGSYAESALTAQLRLTANSDGTGLAWTLQPSYGAGNGDMALAAGPSLWTDEQLEALTGSSSAQESGEMALSSRVGYGIHLQSGELLLTPFTEVRLSEAGSQHIGLGLALEGNSWNVELSSSTEKGANASPTTKTELSFSKRL